MLIGNYLKDGYVVSPYYDDDDIKSINNVITKELVIEDVRHIITGPMDYLRGLLYDPDSLVLIKYPCKYHIKPQDLIEKFENELNNKDLDYKEIMTWSLLTSINDQDGYLFVPHLDDKYYEKDKDGVDDYLFKKDDHIVSFIMRLIKQDLRENRIEEDLKSYVNFIKDVTSKKNVNEYCLETRSLMVHSLCYELYKERKLSKEAFEFYRNNLIANANDGDNHSMRTLGYEYYEGTNGFPLDQNKSLYWLDKYFNNTGDPDVARTLGYIYYYGRNNNGIPEGDKAFQCFAIGHLAGGYFEATYKLADCYIKGYGTPICHQAAFNLVDGIYQKTLNYFLDGEDSKFADVALRLGNYYRNGIYVKKNLLDAQIYYLEAKVAIKERLKHMEYVGDRGVAMSISKSLDEVQKEMGIKDRVIIDDGYLANGASIFFDGQRCFIDFKDDEMFITIKRPNKKDSAKYFINYISSLGFVERSEKIVFKLIPTDVESAKEFVESIKQKKVKEIGFDNEDKFYVIVDMGKGETFPAFTTYDKLIFYPQTIKDISKKYNIVSVEFYPDSKTYDYLCLKDDVSIGDTLTINSNGENKSVVVTSIKSIYEDELPLPYEKMAKAK